MSQQIFIKIGLPAYGGQLKTKCAVSLMRLIYELTTRKINFAVMDVDIHDVSEARNVLASSVFHNPQFTHLLQIDWDMIFNPSAVFRMLATGHDVIGCICQKRNVPEFGVGSFNVKAHPRDRLDIVNGVAEVVGIGAAISIVTRQALLKIADTQPLRRQSKHGRPSVSGEILGFFDRTEGANGERIGEDYSFCLRWTKSGGKIYGLAGEDIGHIDTQVLRAQITDLLTTILPSQAPPK